MEPEARWVMTEAVRDGHPLWVRRNAALVAAPSHPLLLSVRVAAERGEPGLGAFERALFGLLGQGDLCRPAAVVTSAEGQRFLLYARELALLVPRLAFLRRTLPLGFTPALRPDPDWAVFRRLPGRA
jgi:hypothetical protein